MAMVFLGMFEWGLANQPPRLQFGGDEARTHGDPIGVGQPPLPDFASGGRIERFQRSVACYKDQSEINSNDCLSGSCRQLPANSAVSQAS